MNLSDEERERVIGTFAALFGSEVSPALRRYWWSMMQEMIQNRSPAQIKKMQDKEVAA